MSCLVFLEDSQLIGIMKKNLIVEMFTEMCSNVEVEPRFERLSGEFLALRTSKSGEEGAFFISANGDWGSRFEKALFVVKVFNPCAK